MTIRIAFAGTPDIAVPSLQVLLDSPFEVVAVFTQPDRPAGRGRKVQQSPVKQLAMAHSVPVFQPNTFKQEEQQRILHELNLDLFVVVAYGMILPKAVLDIPKLGCINMHPSILPQYRGPIPIQACLLNGDKETGVTIMQLDEKMDAGPILKQAACVISPQETSHDLHDRLAVMGAEMLEQTIHELIHGDIIPVIQDHTKATYCKKIQKADASVDWNLTAEEIVNRVRAYNSWPVAYTEYAGERLRVWQAAVLHEKTEMKAGVVVCSDPSELVIAAGKGCVSLQQVQLPGKKALPIKEFMSSQQTNIIPGETRLGDDNER